MALTATAYNTGASAIQGQATYMGLASDNAGATATTHTRQAITWGAPSGGSFGTVTVAKFTGGAASGAVQSVTLWTAATGGTLLGWFPITSGDTTSNSSGEFNVPSGTISPSPIS